MKFGKRLISLFLAVLMATSVVTAVDFSANAQADNISEYTIYKYEYFSDKEAKAFIGFLLGTNDLNEQLWDTDIFKFLTGKLSNNPEKENEARIAFLSVSTEMLNARIKDNEQKTNIASTNLIVFLKNRYGIDLDAELVNPLINKEFGSIKEMIKGFISIATDTDLVEIDAVDSIFSSVELIVNRDKKIEEYTKCVQAIFDLTKFTTSAQQLDMYRQFMLYISNAKCYLDFGDTNISQTIVELSQNTYDLYNERSKWADCISNIVQRVDVFGLLNDYWLNWSTDERIKLLKKWASFIALSQNASEECAEPVLTSYTKTRQSIIKSDGTTISYRARKYNIEKDLTYEIDKADLKYTIKNNNVVITDYIGYAGKYKNVSIPTKIDGKKVTEIAEHAFDGCNFSTIIIPRNIKKIGDYSFYGNNGIQKLLILNNDVKIGDHAFDWQMGPADQSIGNVPVYCEYNSKAYEFCSKKEGFFYKSLYWDGASVWGVASSNNTYHINCGAQLAYISELAKKVDLEGFTISIDSNIYLGNKDFMSIGDTDHPYKGSFNGNGNEIFGLKYKHDNDHEDNNGLFSYVIGNGNKFSDIELYGQQTNGAETIGDLIGTLYVKENSNVTISNITTNIVDSNNGVGNRGGIVGKIIGNSCSDIKLENCKNLAYKHAFQGYVGGIVGYSNLKDNSSLQFYNCLNNATVNSSVRFAYEASLSGGIVGKGEGGIYKFKECAVDGSIYSEGNGSLAISGGLVATLTPSSVKIEDCELFAYVYGSQYFSSGIVGNLITKNINYNESYIKNSYVSDYIPDKYAAGFISCDNKETYNLPIINSYFNNDVSKSNYLVVQLSAGGFFYDTVGVEEKEWCVNSSFKTGNELKTNHALYDEWDFVNVWKYDESGYPILKCFENITPCSEHNYINKIVSPTCTAKGYTTHTCSKCGYTYNDTYVDALGHDYSVYSKTVAPTCTDKGYDVYNCSRGDAWTKYNLVPALGHNYSENATGHKNPTCTDKGYDEYTCSRCNNIEKRNYVDALGHVYSEKPTAHKDPTCNSKGYDEYTCSRCNGTKQDEIAALDGSALTSALDNAKKKMESGVFTDESVSACQKVCDKYQNAVNELHSQAEVDNATAEVTSVYENLVLKDVVTGTLDNGMTWTFTKDGGKLSFEGDGEVPKFESGTAPWNLCGKIETLEFGEGTTSIAGYAFTNYTTVKKINFPSTLTTINIRAFEYCYAVEELVIPDSVTFVGYGTFASLTSLKKVTVPASAKYASYAFEHDENIEEIFITPGADSIMPDCTRTGQLVFPFYQNSTGAYGPWRVAKNATVTVQDGVTSIGMNTFYNAVSGNLTINIPASVNNIGKNCFATNGKTVAYVENANCVIDETNLCSSNVNVMVKSEDGEYAQKPHTHTWGEWKYNNDAVYNSPTDYKNGTQTRICTTCGENETVEAPNTGLLRINTVSLSLESSITMNFKVFKNSLSSFDDFYMTFECGGKEEKVTNYKQDGNYYVFSYKGINPQLMNDKVTAVLHAKNSNGEYTSPEKVMSVREYAYTMLDRYSSDEHSKLRTLLVDLLNYGSATQKYVGYQTDNLANSDLTATQKSWASKDTKEFKNIRNFNYKTISNPTVQWNSCGLVLGNAIMFKVKFTANNVENKTVEITLRNAKFTYDKNDFKDNGDGTYYVYCNELFAHEVSDEVLLTVYENGVPCSNTMRFSVESYARLVRDNYKGTPLDEMITTMMLYGKSAKEYKNV